MSRALIIKNADFSVNKLGTITIEEEVPCTGITLNKASLALTSIGSTSALVATVTPSDTTDAVIWSTSDADVVTVAGGTLTAIACGNAVITATCGTHSATCEVEVTHILEWTSELNRYFSKSSSKDYLDAGDLTNYATGYSVSGSKKIYGASDKYPLLIPNGANKIEIECPGFNPYGFWLSSKNGSQYDGDIAYAYAQDDNFKYNGDIKGSRSVTIPDRTSGTYEGMDAFALVFRYRDGTITQELVDAIVVTFTA